MMTPAFEADAPHVVIVGGGVAGLATAWFLERQADEAGAPVRVTVLEAGGRWGGKVQTVALEADGQRFLIEAGPDSFLTQKPWAVRLARALGLEADLIPMRPQAAPLKVLSDGRLVDLPEGVMLLAPTRLWPFVRSPLLSWAGKLRAALDMLLPARRGEDDESLGAFVRRRLGGEVLEKIAEPLMAGIYNADADRLSLMATFPRFREVERTHGSLIRGLRPAAGSTPSGAAFMTLRDGVQGLTDALVRQVRADLCLDAPVRSVESDGVGGYRVWLADGQALTADAVVLASPAAASARLLGGLAPEAAACLRGFRTVSTGSVMVAYRESDVPRPLRGSGAVIPTGEGRPFNAITVASNKFDGRAPAGYVLMRVFFGGARSPQSLALSDAAVLAMVRAELAALLGVQAAPVLEYVVRWPDSSPQYEVGHLAQVEAIERALPSGVWLTGSAYRGVGLPDCVQQAERTASQVWAWAHQREGRVTV
ncbi:MAG: protoporphyrinogen oxidase [Anaerolineae bacterium]|nr:protoporphyrinogen oxidase [Anaerolineae bacterium]